MLEVLRKSPDFPHDYFYVSMDGVPQKFDLESSNDWEVFLEDLCSAFNGENGMPKLDLDIKSTKATLSHVKNVIAKQNAGEMESDEEDEVSKEEMMVLEKEAAQHVKIKKLHAKADAIEIAAKDSSGL